jgi:hypothetical protein
MARQGRFGRSETGASNLSATIRSLVAQQLALEEQLFMNAFYNGLPYKGKILTMADVTKFYEDMAMNAGIVEGTDEWEAIQQKIAAAQEFQTQKDDQAIRGEYDALKSEFEASNGENFQDVMDFLGGRAQETSDPNDAAVYENAKGDFVNAYIGYRGEAMIRGEITAVDYRALASEALSNLGVDTSAYKEGLYNSYQFEWSAVKRQMDDRLIAGKINSAQYLLWARDFRKTMVAAGVQKGSGLFDAVNAAIAIEKQRVAAGAGGGVGATPAGQRIDKTTNRLNKAWEFISMTVGGGEGGAFLGEGAPTTKTTLERYAKNPDYIYLAADWIDKNPFAIPEYLRKRGVIDGDSFKSYVQGLMNDGLSDAQILYAQGFTKGYQEWVDVNSAAGAISPFAQIKYTATRWRDERNAAGNDQMVAWLDNEYAKYLEGGKSYFGQIPPGSSVTPEVLSIIDNEYKALKGDYVPGELNVSNYGEDKTTNDEIATDFSLIGETAKNAQDLSSGKKVNVWNKETGRYSVEDPRAAGLSSGQYQYVAVYKQPDGTMVSEVRIVKGKQIISEDTGEAVTGAGNSLLFAFETEDGTTMVIDSNGKEYNSDFVGSDGAGGFIIPSGGEIGDVVGDAKRFDYSGIAKTTPMGAVGDSFLERKAMAGRMTAADLEEATQVAQNVLGGVQDRKAVEQITNDINTALVDAGKLGAESLRQLSGGQPDAATRIKIAELEGDTRKAEFLRNRAMFYNEVSPNYFVPKPEYSSREAQGPTSDLARMLGDQGSAILGAIPGIGTLFNLGRGAESFLTGSQTPVEDFRTEEQKKVAKTYGAAVSAPQIESLQRTGYNTQGPASVFFRNVNNVPKPPTSITTPISGISTYLGLQANVPRSPMPSSNVSAPKPPSVSMVGLGSIALKGVAGDSLAERRQTYLRTAPKTPPVVPLNVAGKGGGGR